VNVELKTNVSDICSVTIIGVEVDMMMEAKMTYETIGINLIDSP
jgi:hypothetical protein